MRINMFNYQKLFPKRSLKKDWISIIIFITGIMTTSTIAYFTNKGIENQANLEFGLVCNEIRTKIVTRLYSHAQLLRSGSAYFSASDTITRDKWNTFYKLSKLNRNMPGIQGLGFSIIVKKEQLQEHIKNIRKEGFPTYTVKPEGDREFYTSIIFLEPFDFRNQRAFGYDMFSEPVRRKAMEEARDFDIAALTGKVLLVQETDNDLQAGALMYVPVYNNRMPAGTIEERRAAIIGWVYSPYRMSDLMNGILGRWDLNDDRKIHLQIYDNDNIRQSSLLFNSQSMDIDFHNDLLERIHTIPILFNGKKWTFLFSQPNNKFSYLQSKVLTVLISGFIISLLLLLLSSSLLNTLSKAREIAAKLSSKLKGSEEMFTLFMDFLPAIVFLKDSEGKVLFVNKFMEKEISNSNRLGKNMFEIFPNEFGAKLLADDLRVMKIGYEKIEEQIKLSDGKIHYFETQKFIIPQHDCEPYLGVISLDITTRILAEQAHKESEQRWKFAIEGVRDGLWDRNLETNEVFYSSQWKAMLGFKEHEIEGNIEEWSNKVHKDDIQKCYADIQLHLDGKTPFYTNNHRVQCKDGTYKWILARGQIVKYDQNAKPIRMIGTHTDLTERIEIENQLIKLNSDKDLFITILAHDLRSPFNAILGFLDLTIKNIRIYDINQIEKNLKIVNTSAKNTFKLLEDILLWVRANSGKIPFEPQMYSLSPICNEIIDSLKLTANNKNIKINNLSTDDIHIFADKNMLSTVLRNLISNAIKFTNKGGTINLNTKITNRIIEITISDNGVGMPAEIINIIFDISQKVSTRGTEKESGTGLGLLLCKEFIEKHNGRIWVESEVDKGSDFKFTMQLYNN